ncbi:MAG: CvpA family protein [Candidatus Omnitrophota bacterium]
MPHILQEANWLDIVFVVMLIGMTYKGVRTGVSGQLLSLVGNGVLVFVSIAYYSFVSEAIFGFLLQKWMRPATFFAIAMVVFVATKVLERVFNIAGREDLAPIDRVFGAFVALIRGAMLCGIMGMSLLLVPLDTTRADVSQESRTGMFFVNMDAQIYSWMTAVQPQENQKNKDEIINGFLNLQY